MTDKNNKTFCMAPWVHMNIIPNGDVFPCCEGISAKENVLQSYEDECIGKSYPLVIGSVMNNSLEEIWNNDSMKKLRKNMLCGNESEFCTCCYNQEKFGVKSLRQTYNDLYKKHYKYVKETKEDGTFERFNLVYWDFRLNNICNFKCRMCGPGYSSSREQEMQKEYNISGKFPKINIDMINNDIEPLYDIVEEIYFAGGEPLISDYHYHILNKLIEKRKTNVKIRYNTNFSVLKYKEHDIIQLWKKFDNIQLTISIDGTGKRGELIRKGFNWKKFIENWIIFRRSFPSIPVNINCVVQSLNCFDVMDLQKKLCESNILKSPDDFSLCILQNPNFMSVTILTPNLKNQVIEKIKVHIIEYLIPRKSLHSIKEYESLLKILVSEDESHLIPNFRKYIDELDRIRNENTMQIFPELEEIFLI